MVSERRAPSAPTKILRTPNTTAPSSAAAPSKTPSAAAPSRGRDEGTKVIAPRAAPLAGFVTRKHRQEERDGEYTLRSKGPTFKESREARLSFMLTHFSSSSLGVLSKLSVLSKRAL